MVSDFVEVVSAGKQLQQVRKVVGKVEVDNGSTVFGGQSSRGREFEEMCGDTLFVMSERSKDGAQSSKQRKDEMYNVMVVRYKERKRKQK